MKLSRREAQILGLLSEGQHPKKIASMLGIEYQSVITRIFTARERLGAKTRYQAIAIFTREKIKDEI